METSLNAVPLVETVSHRSDTSIFDAIYVVYHTKSEVSSQKNQKGFFCQRSET